MLTWRVWRAICITVVLVLVCLFNVGLYAVVAGPYRFSLILKNGLPPSYYDFQKVFRHANDYAFEDNSTATTAGLVQPVIQKYCANVNWKPNMYIMCTPTGNDAILMGTFNARDRLQVCMRYAMDAGLGLIIPNLRMRSSNLSDLYDDTIVPLNYLFDSEYFFEAMHQNCPQMKLAKYDDLENRVEITVNTSNENREYLYPGRWNEYVQNYTRLYQDSIHDNSTVIFSFAGDYILRWLIPSDEPKFQIAFRTIVRFDRQLIRIAQELLSVLPRVFVGAHLRLEDDAKLLFYTSGTKLMWVVAYEQLDHALWLDYSPVLYVACGDRKKKEEFSIKAHEQGVEVVDKWDLLEQLNNKNLTEEVKAMGFDRMAVIDYAILTHAASFSGLMESSFAFGVGIDRWVRQHGNMEYDIYSPHERLVTGSFNRISQFQNHTW